MLFRAEVIERIRRGEVTVAFRRWKRPTVVPGGTLRTPAGVLRIDDVTVIDPADITVIDARAAGFDTPDAARADLRAGDDRQLYRIGFHVAGDDPRTALGMRAPLDYELSEIDDAIERLDRARGTGPRVRNLLDLIGEQPGDRSAALAARLGIDQQQLKRKVRRLKDLGLTESLDTGYRLTVRGRSYRDRGPDRA